MNTQPQPPSRAIDALLCPECKGSGLDRDGEGCDACFATGSHKYRALQEQLNHAEYAADCMRATYADIARRVAMIRRIIDDGYPTQRPVVDVLEDVTEQIEELDREHFGEADEP